VVCEDRTDEVDYGERSLTRTVLYGIRTLRIFSGAAWGQQNGPSPARRRRGRACRIRSVDLTIRKWQREERTTIANKHALDLLRAWPPPCLFQPPQLYVRGKLATGICQTSSSIFTLARRDERVQHHGGGGAGGSSSSSRMRRNVLCRSGPQTTHQMDRPAPKGKVRSEGRVLQKRQKTYEVLQLVQLPISELP
jgi:hypothetical protein